LDILIAVVDNVDITLHLFSTFEFWEEVVTDEVGVNWLVSFQHGVFLYDLRLSKNFFGDTLKRWSTILAVELDSEIFIWATRVVTGAENDASKAIACFVILVQLSDHSGYSWGREEAVLADIDFFDAVADGDFDDSLSSYVVVISTISRHYKGFANILGFRKGIENRLYEIFEVVLLFEDLHLFPEATCSGLLVVIGSRLNFFDG